MIALILVALLSTGTFDDDGVLEFFWDAATGNVHHYDVYVSINDGDFSLDGNTVSLPTAESLYILKTFIAIGSQVVVKVQAVDSLGGTGPMSEASDPVWRVSKAGRQPRSE